MDPITQQAVLAAAGAGGDAPLTVDDVFSTSLYSGTAAAKTITNSIKLSSEGGLVWIKRRGASESNALFDTERGATKRLSTNSNNPEATASADLTAFNNDGFTLGSGTTVNASGATGTYVSWTFRKAPGFFDICEWTGNSVSGRQIAHNLESAPGFILIKSYVPGTGGTGWMCYHRSLGNTTAIRLDNGSAVKDASSAYWNNTDPTSTHFTVGNQEDINTSDNGRSYVAYVFAHASPVFGTGGDESIVFCGTYAGTGNDVNVNCGFSAGAKFVFIKRTDVSSDWYVYDTARGIVSGNDPYLLLNDPAGEVTNTDYIDPLSSGFTVTSSAPTGLNASGGTYIFLAIA